VPRYLLESKVKNLNYQEEHPMKRFGLILCLLFTVLAACFRVNAEKSNIISLPEPTGKYGVGTITYPLTDTSRIGEKYANNNNKATYRELMIQIWYPANKETTGKTQSYIDNITTKLLEEWYPGVNLSAIKTHAVSDAPVADMVGKRCALHPIRYPVLVFSPGSGMMYSFYQSLLEDLASHGYIVVGVNHPNFSGITVMPNGNYYIRSLPDPVPEEYANTLFSNLVADLQFIARQLRKIDYKPELPLAGHMDLEHLGVLGHSFGGVVAVQTCIDRPEYKAALNFDGPPYGEGYQNPIHKPMMMVMANEDHGNVGNDFNTFWTNIKKGYKIKVIGSVHNSFTDFPILSLPELLKSIFLKDSTIASEQVVKITRDCTRYFFDTTLQHQNLNLMPSLVQKYPEVTIEEHKR
jgi:dienelactone hydrolase